MKNSDLSDLLNKANMPFCEELLFLALKNLENEKDKYYSFIKEYIICYPNLDSKIKPKLKKIIVFIQKTAEKEGSKDIMKKLQLCLNNFKTIKSKSVFQRLQDACIKHNEDKILQALLSII